MAYNPISGIVPQISKNSRGGAANGYYLKAYYPGTVTPLSMSIDQSASLVLAKCKLNSRGEPISNDSDETTVFIPYFNQDYKLALFQNSTDANNNDVSEAVWIVDDIQQAPNVNAANTALTIDGTATNVQAYLSSTSSDYTFTTVSNMAARLSAGGETITPILGYRLSTEGFYSSSDGGTADYIITNDTPNAIDKIDMGGGFTATMTLGGSLSSIQLGITASSTAGLTRLFEITEVSTVVIDEGVYAYDNSASSLSFQSNIAYKGNGAVFINFTDETQRLFLTTSKTGFSVENINTNGNTELMEDSLGGGYWRFETCTDFTIDGGGVSKIGWDGVKVISSSKFTIKNTTCNWVKSTAITVEGCNNFDIHDNHLSKNGRNSSDDSFADLPVGWAGTHIGRGITLVATSGGTPCSDFRVYNNTCDLNTEYGIRSYGQSPLIGNIEGDIYNNIVKSSGHPAGTYGTVVLAAPKGVDILINNSTAGESSGIDVFDNKIYRTQNYGAALSIAGTNNNLERNRIYYSSAAINATEAIIIFDLADSLVKDNRSYNVAEHIVVASSVEDIVISGERGINCSNGVRGTFSGGYNEIKDCRFKHHATTATSTEQGIDVEGEVNIQANHLGGFYYGVELSGTFTGNVTRNKTVSSVNNGFRNFITDNSGITSSDNNFDSVNPNSGIATSIGNTSTPRGAGISFEYTIPTAGYYRRGHFVIDSQPGAITNGRKLFGWLRLAEGSAHVSGTDWQEVWVETSSTS